MIWHPLVLSILVLDMIGLLLVSAASITSVGVFFNWDSRSADREQIRLERRVEIAAAKAKWALYVYGFALLIFVIGVSNVMPELIPGAMCGTGVMEAAGGHGNSALLWRGLTLFVLYCTYVLHRMDQQNPFAPFVIPMAGLTALVFPYAALGTYFTFSAVLGMDLLQPVYCCTFVYDWMEATDPSQAAAILSDGLWVGLTISGWALITISGLSLCRGKYTGSIRAAGLLAVSSPAWTIAAVLMLTQVLTPYHYQVPAHHCPWCLFLPEHSFIGFILFGILCIVPAEGLLPLILPYLTKKYGGDRQALLKRCRRAALNSVLAASAFLIAAGLPAMLWRLRYGVWITD